MKCNENKLARRKRRVQQHWKYSKRRQNKNTKARRKNGKDNFGEKKSLNGAGSSGSNRKRVQRRATRKKCIYQWTMTVAMSKKLFKHNIDVRGSGDWTIERKNEKEKRIIHTHTHSFVGMSAIQWQGKKDYSLANWLKNWIFFFNSTNLILKIRVASAHIFSSSLSFAVCCRYPFFSVFMCCYYYCTTI